MCESPKRESKSVCIARRRLRSWRREGTHRSRMAAMVVLGEILCRGEMQRSGAHHHVEQTVKKRCLRI